jgi:1,4-dihydroxy-2-naphthoyl-CoA hydrolase
VPAPEGPTADDSPVPEAVVGLTTGARPSVHDLLELTVVELTPERVVLRLPVTWKVHQPYGILHGGVSALLAESAASMGGAVSVAPDRQVVGIELNCSHLRALTEGTLTATATPIRKGRTVHVWDIALTDDAGRDIARARCTLAVTGGPGASPTTGRA